MSTNRHALIRYRTIDKCLRSDTTIHLKDLIEACSQALTEFEGRPVEIKRRSLLYDLKFMKAPTPGFNAPIVHSRDKGYHYTDVGYVLFADEAELDNESKLDSVIRMLKEMSRSRKYKDLKGVASDLERMYLAPEEAPVETKITVKTTPMPEADPFAAILDMESEEKPAKGKKPKGKGKKKDDKKKPAKKQEKKKSKKKGKGKKKKK